MKLHEINGKKVEENASGSLFSKAYPHLKSYVKFQTESFVSSNLVNFNFLSISKYERKISPSQRKKERKTLRVQPLLRRPTYVSL